MACNLTLTPQQARDVIEGSEGREPGPGHTKQRHVTISKADLLLRRSSEDVNGETIFFGAFIDIHDCASALSMVIEALGANSFISEFCRRSEGAVLRESRVLIRQELKVRYAGGAGVMPTQHFSIAACKMVARPHELHLITFYPSIALP